MSENDLNSPWTNSQCVFCMKRLPQFSLISIILPPKVREFITYKFVYKIDHFAGPRGDVTPELPDKCQRKSNKGSTLSKISTKKYKYQQKCATFFIKNLTMWWKILVFGLTVICGRLFSGTFVDWFTQSTTITNLILGLSIET